MNEFLRSQLKWIFCNFLFVLLTQGEESSTDRLLSGHLTKFLDEDVCADVSSLHIQKIISVISELVERLKSYGEDYTAYKCKVLFIR